MSDYRETIERINYHYEYEDREEVIFDLMEALPKRIFKEI